MKRFLNIILLSLFIFSPGLRAEGVYLTVILESPGTLVDAIVSQGYYSTDLDGLTVIGPLNRKDWTYLHYMRRLKHLDLGQAVSDSVPGETFMDHSLETLVLPSTLCYVGRYAMQDCASLTSVTLPDGLRSIDRDAFSGCVSLASFRWPAGVSTVPQGCFDGCSALEPFDLPEGVTAVGDCAFRGCVRYKTPLPSTLRLIGRSAFMGTAMEQAVVSEGCGWCEQAFADCPRLTLLDLPMAYIYAPWHSIAPGCPQLADVYLRCPTMIPYDDYGHPVALHVPTHLLEAYRSDPGWSTMKSIEPVDMSYAATVPLMRDLTLDGTRLDGTPALELAPRDAEGISLVVRGGLPMAFGGILVHTNKHYSRDGNDNHQLHTQVLCDYDGVRVEGPVSHEVYLSPRMLYTGELAWHFLAMPFDFRPSDVACTSPHELLLYDASARADGGAPCWKEPAGDAVVRAGEGFAIRVDDFARATFTSLDNGSRQNIVSGGDLAVAMQPCPSSSPVNAGWNLIGNPWLTHFDLRQTGITRPVTVWNEYEGRFDAYSPADDHYTLHPGQAMFVQCPDGGGEAAFPAGGRRLSAGTVYSDKPSGRAIVSVVIRQEDFPRYSDHTRLVVNPLADEGYEAACDAPKFLVTPSMVPALYTLLDDGTEMAINERPRDGGTVRLGIMLPTAGSYVIATGGGVTLFDLYMDGQDLGGGEYRFTAEAGRYDDRFELRINEDVLTGVAQPETSPGTQPCGVLFDLQGRRVQGTPQRGLYIRDGKKVLK